MIAVIISTCDIFIFDLDKVTIMFHLTTAIYIFLFGMCIGSFMNVCIYRLPISKSIADPPRSVCPSCDRVIRYYDNIPVFSYFWLKGRCRHCGAPISWRYPLVEIMSGFFALCVFRKFGLTFEGFFYYAFISSLLVITFIDIDHQIIPNSITLPGIPIFFLASFIARKPIWYNKILLSKVIGLLAFFPFPETTYNSILGILTGGGSLYLVGKTYYLIKKEEGMGGGDIKLLAMIGALLGWEGVFFTIFVGSAVGTFAGIINMISTRLINIKARIPFGPFLSIGAITYIFYGKEIIEQYFKMLR